MKKENIERLMEVIREKEDDIINLGCELYKFSMNGSYFQAMSIGIIANIDGTIRDFVWSQGTSSMDIYNGDAVIVLQFTCNNETGWEGEINKEDLDSVEILNFLNWLEENEMLEEDKNIIDYLTYDNVREFDEDIIERIENEYIDCWVDNYGTDNCKEQIERCLENLLLQLENEEY